MPRNLNTSAKSQYTREACEKWKELPTLTLARLIYERRPQYFPNLQAARHAVRYVRGNNGAKARRIATANHKSLFRPPGKAGFVWTPPESIAKEWTSFILDTPKNLIISDLHIPFHDPAALEVAVARGVKWQPDCLLINGDFGDFYSISRFDKDPTVSHLRDEIDAMRQGLGWLRQKFPKARIVYKLGNHDEWWEAYLCRKAPELVGLNCTKLENILTEDIGDGTGEIGGIEFVKDQRRIMLGKLPVLHGHELGKGFAPPVNPARGAFLKAIDHILVGHHHQYSTHQSKTIMGKIIVTFSTGCLCQMNPKFARVNQWAHGFAEVEVSKGHAFEVRNWRIVNGKIY